MKKILTLLIGLTILTSSIPVSAATIYCNDGTNCTSTITERGCNSSSYQNYLLKLKEIFICLISGHYEKIPNCIKCDNKNCKLNSDIVPEQNCNTNNDNITNTDNNAKTENNNTNTNEQINNLVPNKEENKKSEDNNETPVIITPSEKPVNLNNNPQKEDNKDEQGTTKTSENNYASEVVKIVNEERVKAGLNKVNIDTNVQKAAQIRAEEQEKLFSHTRPNGTSCFTALKENGVNYMGAGENIAMGQKTPSEVMRGWMNSSGHRKNILNPKFKNIGVGVHRDSNGKYYWTQMFTY